MLKRLLRPHGMIVTALTALLIALLNTIPLNLHFLDPFNEANQDYEITDIFYTQFNPDKDVLEDRIMVINSGKPDRAQIARLISRLDSAQAAVIGVDFLFEERLGTSADTLLQESLKQAEHLVLAVELMHDPAAPDTYLETLSVDTFFSNHAQLGFINFPGDEYRTKRWFQPSATFGDQSIDAFATEIAHQYAPDKANILLDRQDGLEEIHFLGNRDNFFRFNIDQVLDYMPFEEVKAKFEGKIVLLGYAVEDATSFDSEEEWLNPLIDRHYSPLNKTYTGKSLPDMFGVILHANVLRMVLNEEYIQLMPNWLKRLINILFCYFNVLIIYWIYHKFHDAFHGVTRILQIGEAILIFFVMAWLFNFFRIKLQMGWGILALLLAYDVIEFYESWMRERWPVLNKIPDHFHFSRSRVSNQSVNSSQTSLVDNSLSGDAG